MSIGLIIPKDNQKKVSITLIGEKFGVIGRDIESIEQFFHQEGI